jgi:hypothetical protein
MLLLLLLLLLLPLPPANVICKGVGEKKKKKRERSRKKVGASSHSGTYLHAEHLLCGTRELLDVPYDPLLVSVVLRRLHGERKRKST